MHTHLFLADRDTARPPEVYAGGTPGRVNIDLGPDATLCLPHAYALSLAAAIIGHRGIGNAPEGATAADALNLTPAGRDE